MFGVDIQQEPDCPTSVFLVLLQECVIRFSLTAAVRDVMDGRDT